MQILDHQYLTWSYRPNIILERAVLQRKTHFFSFKEIVPDKHDDYFAARKARLANLANRFKNMEDDPRHFTPGGNSAAAKNSRRSRSGNLFLVMRCCVVVLLCCRVVMLSCCHVVMLSCCHVVMLSCCHAVNVVILCC